MKLNKYIGFVKDHKKAFIFGGIAIGASVLTGGIAYDKGYMHGFQDGGYNNAIKDFLWASKMSVGPEATAKIYDYAVDHMKEMVESRI